MMNKQTPGWQWIGSRSGFSLTELMVVILIFVFILGGVLAVFMTGQNTWFNTDTRIELQQELRKTLIRVGDELQASGYDNTSTAQFTISDGGGVGGTDLLTFSVPIICETGGFLINANGDVANWGAPLTWGCDDSSCMDADNDCNSRDYKSIQYAVDANNQLVRRVLDNIGGLVAEVVFAQNITDFQVSLAGGGNMIDVSVTAQKKSAVGEQVTASASLSIYLRNH